MYSVDSVFAICLYVRDPIGRLSMLVHSVRVCDYQFIVMLLLLFLLLLLLEFTHKTVAIAKRIQDDENNHNNRG